MVVYASSTRRRELYEQIVQTAPDLRGRLAALVQASHAGADPADVEAVRAALWEEHQDGQPTH